MYPLVIVYFIERDREVKGSTRIFLFTLFQRFFDRLFKLIVPFVFLFPDKSQAIFFDCGICFVLVALSWFLKALFPDVGLFGRVDGLCMVLHPAGEMIRDDERAVEDTELM